MNIKSKISVFMLGLTFGIGISCVLGFSVYSSHDQTLNDRFPRAHTVSHKEGYTLAFDGRTKNPLWVFQDLTQESFANHADRKKCRFKQDPDVPKHIQSDVIDYQSSEYDRGHLVPAIDCSFSQEAMEETFLLSNISPQMVQFNRGYWKKLENYVRELVYSHGRVQVISGPLYLPSESSSGCRSVSYPVIGLNDVAVPTHFFKLVKVGEGDISYYEAYILPNESIDSTLLLEQFRVDRLLLEKVSGIIFETS